MLDLRANGLAASITRSGFVTGGASSTGTRDIARPSSQEQCHHQEARAICAPGCDFHPHRQRSAHNRADGTVNSGDQLWLGIAPAKAAAGRSRNDRQSSGKLRHPLRQRRENVALPVGARTTPFGDLGQRASAAGAMARTRIERADVDARRFRCVDNDGSDLSKTDYVSD